MSFFTRITIKLQHDPVIFQSGPKCSRHFIESFILVKQRFRAVDYGISHESLVFSRYTHKPLGKCVYRENTSDKWNIQWYTTRERCITILYHAIEDKVANNQRDISRGGPWEVPSNKQRLSCILIGCISYGVV